MAKADKKKAKIQERIAQIETELRVSLQKKASSATKIDMPGKTRQLAELRKQLAEL